MKNTSAHHYTWQNPSPIARVELVPCTDGPYTARLYAQEGAAQTVDLAVLPKILHKYGFAGAYADVHNGQNVLVIPHVKEGDKLVQALQSVQYVQGGGQHQEVAVPQQKKPLDTLKWSGRTGLIGHAALMVNGVLQGEWGQVIAGPLGASTAGILAKYGNGKSDIDFDTMLKNMNQYFADEGVAIPPLDTPEKKQSILGTVNDVLSKYPLQIGYTVGTLGALSLMQSGLRRYNMTKGTKAASGIGLMLAGTSSLVGNLAVLFVPEKKKTKAEREKEKNTTFGQWASSLPSTWGHLITHPTEIPGAFYNFVAESPLRFNGGLNFVDNIFYFFNAAGVHKTVKSWKEDHPAKLEALQKELDTLTHQRATPETAKRITELVGGKGEIGQIKQVEKELKMATSFAGKAAPFIALTTALSFGCATFLSAISSKNRSDDATSDAAYEKLYALVTKIAVQMPPERREEMLSRMTSYLSTQEDVKDGEITAQKLNDEVHKRIQAMEQSPWLEKKDTHAAAVRQQAQGAAMEQEKAYSL